ncbi:MAG: hypothetical protein AAF458_18090 [Pseudomonadota bacterium]
MNRKTLPDSASDSTVTSLSDLIRAIPDHALKDHVEEQVELLERAEINLEDAATYYSGLLHDREAFRKLNANYDDPSSNDYLRLRLLALYYIGMNHLTPPGSQG